MDNLVLYLYLIDKLNSVHFWLGLSFFVIMGMLIVYGFALAFSALDSYCEDDYKHTAENLKNRFHVSKLFKILGVIFIIDIVLPSYKTSLLFVANHYVKKSDVPQKVMQIINNELDKYIEKQKGNSL